MMAGAIRKRMQWLALHGVIRGMSKLLARRGDPQGRLIADPAVRTDPVAFTDELRAQGPIVKCRAVYITVDHKIANDLLRSEDFHVLAMGSSLPKSLQWVIDRAKPDLLHPLQPPSMLSVEPPEHTRYRKLVSSVFTTRAVAALRDRVQGTANALLDDLADDAGTVDVVGRYCSQLPVTVIGDILGVPDDARPASWNSVSWARPAWISACRGGIIGRSTAQSKASTSGCPTICTSCGEIRATI
jgi:cytochrome P450